MRTTIAIGTFLAVGVGAAGVGAALNLKGSDTLKDLTVQMLATSTNCGGTGTGGTLTYAGSGSGNGQAGMLAGLQQIAPMSSALGSCGSNSATAEGTVFELDGLSIVADAPSIGAATCNGADTLNTCTPDTTNPTGGLAYNKIITDTSGPADCTVASGGDTATGDAACNDHLVGSTRFRGGIFGEKCDATSKKCTYNLGTTPISPSGSTAGWKKALRILFFGVTATDTGTTGDSTSATLANRNCGSGLRAILANSWTQIMQNCTSGSGGCPAGIQHVFRRNDESGTTDVFSKLVGGPGASQPNNTAPFCNTATQGPKFLLAAPPDRSCTADSDCSLNGGTATTCGGACQTGGALCDTSTPCAGSTGPCIKTGGVPTGTCTTGGAACSLTAACAGSSGPCVFTTGGQCEIGAGASEGIASQFDATLPTINAAKVDYTGTTITECLKDGKYFGSSFTDLQDRDVIRRPCQGTGDPTVTTGANEDVCSTRGDLGLVLPIWDIPAAAGVQGAPVADAFPTNACSGGVFDCLPAIQSSCPSAGGATTYERCSDGSNPNDPALNSASCTDPTVPANWGPNCAPPIGTNLCPVGLCAVPVIQGATTLDPRCSVDKSDPWPGYNTPTSGFSIGYSYDTRVYNLTSWTTAGSTYRRINVPRSTGLAISSNNKIDATANVSMTGAFYRIHAIHTLNGTATCQKPSATDQIGCLVHASPCSIGYAGNAAVVAGQSAAVKVNNVDPDNKCVQCFLDSALCTGTAAPYPLARKLYLNSLIGFQGLTGAIGPVSAADVANENKMATCFAKSGAGSGAAVATGLGFIPLPDTTNAHTPGVVGASFCESATGCNGGSTTSACADNTIGDAPSCTLFADPTSGCHFGP